MSYELVLPIHHLAVGFLLGSAAKQIIEYVYNLYFKVEETVEKVFSTALMIRDSGALMVQESYETSLMLIRNIYDGVLVPILNASRELMLLIKPVFDVAVLVIKTLILVIRQAVELIRLIVNTTSVLLTSVFTTIQSLATNTTATLSSWLTWAYEGSSDTFFNTILYLVGFYIFAQIAILIIKRLVKKIK
jgi:hypothetical protein